MSNTKKLNLTERDRKDIFLNAWKARRSLRLYGFLPDSENAKIVKRLEDYQSKYKFIVTEKELKS